MKSTSSCPEARLCTSHVKTLISSFHPVECGKTHGKSAVTFCSLKFGIQPRMWADSASCGGKDELLMVQPVPTPGHRVVRAANYGNPPHSNRVCRMYGRAPTLQWRLGCCACGSSEALPLAEPACDTVLWLPIRRLNFDEVKAPSTSAAQARKAFQMAAGIDDRRGACGKFARVRQPSQSISTSPGSAFRQQCRCGGSLPAGHRQSDE